MRIGLFLIPGFGLFSFAGIVDSLFQVRKFLEPDDLTWDTIGSQAALVPAASGMELAVQHGIEEAPECDWIVVFGSRGAAQFDDARVLAWLRRTARRGVRIGAVTSGTWLLAKAGLLTGFRCTVHWRDLNAFRETYPSLDATDEIYVIDGPRFTCGGGEAALDMIHFMLSDSFGHEPVSQARELLMHERVRTAQEQQRLKLENRSRSINPVLHAAMSDLDRSTDEPCHIGDMCVRLGVSRRRLEQLFSKQLGISPKQYALRVQLRRARDLLLTTEIPVREVALIVGFDNPAHFSTAFKKRFGLSPRPFRTANRS